MKTQWKVPDNRPLADFAPTIILKAKDFATEINILDASEHGIRPEQMPAAEDVKKVERRLAAEEKKSLGNPDGLGSTEEE